MRLWWTPGPDRQGSTSSGRGIPGIMPGVLFQEGSQRPPQSAPARLKPSPPLERTPRRRPTGSMPVPRACRLLPRVVAPPFIGVYPYTPKPLSCSLFDRAAGVICPCIVLRPDRHSRTVPTSGEQQRPCGAAGRPGPEDFCRWQKYRPHLLSGASGAVRSSRSDQKTYRRMPVQYCAFVTQFCCGFVVM